MKDEQLKNYLLLEIAKMRKKHEEIFGGKGEPYNSSRAEREFVLSHLEKLIKNYDPDGYVITDGHHLYFKEWNDVYAVVVVDDMPGADSEAKHFKTLEEAQKVADILGWQVKKMG
ncbi:hypothetical protein LGW90_03880 [Streptococcus mutans]|jgi:hypothetical protein|uniref:hypothetical protein n=1 Tax=Streptococcus mutans TaxID=1309 RepID=UPI0002B504D9|nr:hypothetical protein [Streptococcus mutans]EMB67402.1 hypothetical protein SMU26_02750 [Streptococcus mutans 3SN1]EMC59259.1 hypothetical protein SMU109_03690 [Streptococcus mutans OMZ175]EMC59824.1 hypothetical protein SMU107_00902 [Streptococcus mutans R221]MCB4971317.1 hypothetical protein [Streptococcus mutans]MCB4973388.1 hypothetical protein [Streptococcus mutans]